MTITVVAEGPSDRAFEHIIRWILETNLQGKAFKIDIADPYKLPRQLADRVASALKFYPSDILVVHRDADTLSWNDRMEEVDRSLPANSCTIFVGVVPVKELESWLLFDEKAIRSAAGNPNGMIELSLPTLSSIESVADPKGSLESLLRQASGLNRRRLRTFEVMRAKRRVSELIEDYGPLMIVPAFKAFYERMRQAVEICGSSK
jgi:hypothetical protein